MKRDFYAVTNVRKTIEEASPIELPQVNRAALWSEHLGCTCVIEPEQDLALDTKRKIRKEIADPGACGNDELPSPVFALRRTHTNVVSVGLPAQHGFCVAQLGTVASGFGQMRGDARVRKQHASARFPYRHHIGGWVKRGKSLVHLVSHQHFVWQSVQLSAATRTLH